MRLQSPIPIAPSPATHPRVVYVIFPEQREKSSTSLGSPPLHGRRVSSHSLAMHTHPGLLPAPPVVSSQDCNVSTAPRP